MVDFLFLKTRVVFIIAVDILQTKAVRCIIFGCFLMYQPDVESDVISTAAAYICRSVYFSDGSP